MTTTLMCVCWPSLAPLNCAHFAACCYTLSTSHLFMQFNCNVHTCSCAAYHWPCPKVPLPQPPPFILLTFVSPTTLSPQLARRHPLDALRSLRIHHHARACSQVRTRHYCLILCRLGHGGACCWPTQNCSVFPSGCPRPLCMQVLPFPCPPFIFSLQLMWQAPWVAHVLEAHGRKRLAASADLD